MSNSPSQPPVPISLKSTGEALEIAWSDGFTQTLGWERLRNACPCATCRMERDKPPEPAPLLQVISPAEAQPLKANAMRPVGNYAYAIDFSDGHNTGIYSFEFLRSLDEGRTKDKILIPDKR